MTLQEAMHKIAKKHGYETWEKYFLLNGLSMAISLEQEAIELFRAHWEAVGVKKGMEQALEVVKHQITYKDTENLIPNNLGVWIDAEDLVGDLQAAIEKLSN